MTTLRTPIAQLEKEKFREPSADNIAVAVVNPDGSSIAGATVNSLATITLNNSTAHVGSVSVFGNLSASLGGNVTLNPSPNWIGLVSMASMQGQVQLVSTPTLFAVVNTSAAGITDSMATILNFPSTYAVTQSGNWNLQSVMSLASLYGKVEVTNTVPVSNSTLFAVVNTGAAVASNTTLNPSPNWIGLVSAASIQGKVEITNTVPVTGTFYQATQPVSGTFWQDTQPVSVATIPSHAVTNAGTFAVQAAQSGNWNIQSVLSTASLYGEMKVTNFPATQPVSIAANINSLATVNNFPATYAVTQSGTWDEVGINDSGNTITVDGTVAVTNAGITTIAGAVAGTEMQVDVLTMPTTAVTGTFWQATQPVSIATVPSHAVTNAGTFAVQNDAAIPAGTNNIGDVDVLSIAAGDNNIGNVDIATALPAGGNYIGLATITEGLPYSSPSIFIGMVSSASGGLVQFPALAVKYATIRAANGNATTCYIGGSLATINNAYPLDAGETIGYSLTNLNQLFLVGVGTSEVRYTGGI